ncbi:protein kinase [Thiotrichales bacterium 19X7-9]|nr:protein kinase [Thiotrichales bacterium 19X7-9]MCF6774963.1 protein kinase [Thiotrichales bacterium 19X7-9]
MVGLRWKSEEEKAKEWEIAKKHHKAKQFIDGVKLKRSKGIISPNQYRDLQDELHTVEHSFISVNEQILAMAGKGNILGEGSFGVVKLAENEQGQLFAIKIVYEAYKSDEELEILKDINILRGYVTREDKHYIVLDYLGETLDNLSFKNDRYRLDVGYQLVHLVCGLNTGKLSNQGKAIFHNDIKPENIVIDEKGIVRLIDFGSASKEKAITLRQGTPYYQAPEVEEVGYSAKTDTYSLGLTLQTFLPKNSKLMHTAELMAAKDPQKRPDKEAVMLDFLTEMYPNTDELSAQLNAVGFKLSVHQARAISVVLESSTPDLNLTIAANIEAIKNNDVLLEALNCAYDYLNSGQFYFNSGHGAHGREQTYIFVQNLMSMKDKNMNNIKNEMSNWVKGYGPFARASGEDEYSRLGCAKKASFFQGDNEMDLFFKHGQKTQDKDKDSGCIIS